MASSVSARQDPHILPDGRSDEYYWLRDETHSNEEVIQHIAIENEHTNDSLSDTEKFQQCLANEMSDRVFVRELCIFYLIPRWNAPVGLLDSINTSILKFAKLIVISLCFVDALWMPVMLQLPV